MFLTPLVPCFTITSKPSGFRGCRWVVLFLALWVVSSAEGAAAGRDGFDKVRLAPNVEFLDGTAIDLLVGLRPPTAPATDRAAAGPEPGKDSATGKALSDLLVDAESDFDLEKITWTDAEEESSGAAATPPDDLGTLEDILDLENLEQPPGGLPPESREAVPLALDGVVGSR